MLLLISNCFYYCLHTSHFIGIFRYTDGVLPPPKVNLLVDKVYWYSLAPAMGFYLPSEVSRLVLSYLLDHDLQDTSVQFLEECPFLQELRQVPQEELSDYTRVNGRSLMEILREYKA